MRVLIADDDSFTAALLEKSLTEFGYEVTIASNGREAFDQIRTGRYRLLISDWSMPEMTGIDLCRQIRRRQCSGYVYIILLTSRSGTSNIVEALHAGADDFITKPFHPNELLVRLRAGERILSLESRDVTILALAKLAESRDPETGAHLERIREYCRVLGNHLAQQPAYYDQVDGDFVELLYHTSPLHDIGKVGITDSVLLKPGKLTPEEYAIMQQHTVIGFETLDAALKAHPEVAYLRMARDIAFTHHERYDGTGYPRRLKAEQIPLCGRIVALADVYDALTTKRVYKPAFDHEQARAIIVEGAGTHFDPAIVEAFLANEDEFRQIHDRFCDATVEDFDEAAQRAAALRNNLATAV